MQKTLDAGRYYVDFAGSEIPSTVNVGSSVELLDANSKEWHFTTQTVTPDQSLEVVVPAGGAWFRAEGNTGTDGHLVVDKYGNLTAADGCASVTEVWTCWDSDPVVVVLNANGDLIHVDDNSGMKINSTVAADGSYEDFGSNIGGSLMSIFLEEGTYTLVATKGWGEKLYELRYGFQSAGKIIVTPVDDVVLPVIPVDPQIPFGDSQVTVSAEVDTMVCDGECIDALFTQAGLTDGSITISIGDSSVRIFKGQRIARIPVGKNAGSIRVVGRSADGSKTSSRFIGLNHADAAMEKVMKDKVATGSCGSASESTSGSSKKIYVYVLIALLVLVAIGYMRRKKATETK
jgi:hypothetical protein